MKDRQSEDLLIKRKSIYCQVPNSLAEVKAADSSNGWQGRE